MRVFVVNTLFTLHFLIVVVWIGLFFVPLNWWPDKILFHFYLTIIIIGHQIIWGLLIYPLTKELRMVCILTTFMQLLRGERIASRSNYQHAFIAEVLQRAGIKDANRPATVLNVVLSIVV
ncbi:MAG: hypothetical protein HYY99_02015, partial [Candidatus Colwellbacteria bacterium]|nr:hypothetical protein [Candidatus Colwellbacteria bacterium]